MEGALAAQCEAGLGCDEGLHSRVVSVRCSHVQGRETRGAQSVHKPATHMKGMGSGLTGLDLVLLVVCDLREADGDDLARMIRF